MAKFSFKPDAGAIGRYYDNEAGKFVSSSTVKDHLDVFINTVSTGVVDALTNDVRNGVITIDDFNYAMKAHIKGIHNIAIGLERGGWANVSKEDKKLAAGLVKRQYDYLDGFISDLKTGKQKLDGTLTRRAQMYIGAARETFYTSREKYAAIVGATHVASRLSPADHCTECVHFDGVFYLIGDKNYKKPGRRQCRTGCKCYEVYATFLEEEGEFEIYSDEFSKFPPSAVTEAIKGAISKKKVPAGDVKVSKEAPDIDEPVEKVSDGGKTEKKKPLGDDDKSQKSKELGDVSDEAGAAGSTKAPIYGYKDDEIVSYDGKKVIQGKYIVPDDAKIYYDKKGNPSVYSKDNIYIKKSTLETVPKPPSKPVETPTAPTPKTHDGYILPEGAKIYYDKKGNAKYYDKDNQYIKKSSLKKAKTVDLPEPDTPKPKEFVHDSGKITSYDGKKVDNGYILPDGAKIYVNKKGTISYYDKNNEYIKKSTLEKVPKEVQAQALAQYNDELAAKNGKIIEPGDDYDASEIEDGLSKEDVEAIDAEIGIADKPTAYDIEPDFPEPEYIYDHLPATDPDFDEVKGPKKPFADLADEVHDNLWKKHGSFYEFAEFSEDGKTIVNIDGVKLVGKYMVENGEKVYYDKNGNPSFYDSGNVYIPKGKMPALSDSFVKDLGEAGISLPGGVKGKKTTVKVGKKTVEAEQIEPDHPPEVVKKPYSSQTLASQFSGDLIIEYNGQEVVYGQKIIPDSVYKIKEAFALYDSNNNQFIHWSELEDVPDDILKKHKAVKGDPQDKNLSEKFKKSGSLSSQDAYDAIDGKKINLPEKTANPLSKFTYEEIGGEIVISHYEGQQVINNKYILPPGAELIDDNVYFTAEGGYKKIIWAPEIPDAAIDDLFGLTTKKPGPPKLTPEQSQKLPDPPQGNEIDLGGKKPGPYKEDENGVLVEYDGKKVVDGYLLPKGTKIYFSKTGNPTFYDKDNIYVKKSDLPKVPKEVAVNFKKAPKGYFKPELPEDIGIEKKKAKPKAKSKEYVVEESDDIYWTKSPFGNVYISEYNGQKVVDNKYIVPNDHTIKFVGNGKADVYDSNGKIIAKQTLKKVKKIYQEDFPPPEAFGQYDKEIGLETYQPKPPPEPIPGAENYTQFLNTTAGIADWGYQNTERNTTRAENDAMSRYTGSTYAGINKQLRNYSPTGGDYDSIIKSMTKAIDKSIIKDNVVVWRGTKDWVDPDKVGKMIGTVISDKAFMSTTLHTGKDSPAIGFAGWDGIIFEIRIPKGAKGAFVEDISNFKSEREIILQRDSKFKILGVEKLHGAISKNGRREKVILELI